MSHDIQYVTQAGAWLAGAPSLGLFCPVTVSKTVAVIVIIALLLYCIVLYCIVLYCIVLYCIVLYCIVLYFQDEEEEDHLTGGLFEDIVEKPDTPSPILYLTTPDMSFVNLFRYGILALQLLPEKSAAGRLGRVRWVGLGWVR